MAPAHEHPIKCTELILKKGALGRVSYHIHLFSPVVSKPSLWLFIYIYIQLAEFIRVFSPFSTILLVSLFIKQHFNYY